MSPSPGETTLLLSELEQGRPETAERLFALVRPRLHQIAEKLFRHERVGHTLQPTALLDDAYLRLIKPGRCRWKDSTHFYAFAARNMRQILQDYGRAHNAAKRGNGVEESELDEARGVPVPEKSHDLSALDEALTLLEELDPRQARIVELRFLVGLSVKETARVLGLGASTVKAESRSGKAFLRREVEDTR